MNTNTAALQDDNSPTMGLQQSANFLRLGLEAMKDLVANGEVPAVVLNQKHTVLLREDLIAYVREEGRKQAEKRRKLAASRAPEPSAGSSTATTRRARPRRGPLPDLGRYELTT